jgi:glycosyltransferase involved in cell wall biosynthesis
MDKPLVTIITPVYNCEKYINETILSVLTQEYKNLEYIVLDDGSNDNTALRLHSYKDRIISIQHANVGEQITVNLGLQMANGKYFMVVNADDPLLPWAVDTLVEFMESHPNIVACYPDWISINEDGSWRSRQSNRDYDFLRMVKYHKCLPSVGTMVHRKVIDMRILRDSQFKWVGDFDYWLRVGLIGEMARIPKVLATWRHSPNQGSNNKGKLMAIEHVKLMEKFFNIPSLPNEILKVKDDAFFWAELSAAYLSKGNDRLYHLMEAIRFYPQKLLNLSNYKVLVEHANYILRR